MVYDWGKIYYVFLDVHQWEGLKKVVEAYFRDNCGNGFQQQARDKVLEARFFTDVNEEWFQWHEWEDKTGPIKDPLSNEPEWSFRWALRDLHRIGNALRTLMSRYIAMKIRYQRAREVLEALEFCRTGLKMDWPLEGNLIK